MQTTVDIILLLETLIAVLLSALVVLRYRRVLHNDAPDVHYERTRAFFVLSVPTVDRTQSL